MKFPDNLQPKGETATELTDEAIRCITKARDSIDETSKSDIGMTYYNDGIYFMNENMPGEAVNMLKDALAILPDNENVQKTLEKAKEMLQRSSDK